MGGFLGPKREVKSGSTGRIQEVDFPRGEVNPAFCPKTGFDLEGVHLVAKELGGGQ